VSKKRRVVFAVGAALAIVILAGFLVPESVVVPVKGASTADWNKDTFWHEPWGASGVHKGIDIFAPAETPVLAATSGFVIFSGRVELGGNVVVILGPKWRVHYYAHLKGITTSTFSWASTGDTVGAVGNSGNAKGRPSHLHYTILSLFPYPWLFDTDTQGWKKMFYLDPNQRLRSGNGI
jgi:peptidoglycan LD-endopeptidase LytH